MTKPIITFFIVFLLHLPAVGPAEDGPDGDSEDAAAVSENHAWGAIGGLAGIYYERIDQEGVSNLIVPFFEVSYITPEFFGLSAGAGLTGYMRDAHGEDREDKALDDDNVVLHKLFLNYRRSRTSIKFGRQALEYMTLLSDYYEAVSLSIEEIDSLTLNAAYVTKVAESDIDKFTDFQNINRDNESLDDFLVAAEITWTVLPETAAVTLYCYHHGNLYQLYGSHAELFYPAQDSRFGFNLDAYGTDEDRVNGLSDEQGEVHDSTIWHINPVIEVHDFVLSAGYVRAGMAVGAREGGLLDDYFNPFNEGDKVFEPDAITWYGGLSWEDNGFSLGLVLGTTDYIDDGNPLTEKEFDIRAGLRLLENLTLETEVAFVDSKGPEGNYSVLEATLFYEF
ncbi:MAG: Opr family porin [Nitrospiraceae bacterium]|nr:MAG: Opr family porin [Nitrospiraceae bacterium]